MARRSPLLKTLAQLSDVERLEAIDDERIDRWRRLGLYGAARSELGLFQVEGLRPVELLLSSGLYQIETLILVSQEIAHRQVEMQRRIAGVARRAAEAGIAVVDVTRPLFRRIANVKKLRGVMAIARMGGATADELIRRVAERRGLGLAAVAVTDPGNLGTLIRSAHAFGVGAVLALEGATDPFHPKTVRGAAGHLLPAVSATWDEARAACRRLDVELIGLEVGGAGAVPLETLEPDRSRAALVCVGSEGSGFPAGVSGFDRTVSIAMSPGTDSLNVAVAGSLVLWRLSTTAARRGSGARGASAVF